MSEQHNCPNASDDAVCLSISDLRGAKNPYKLEQTLAKLRHYFSATKRLDGLELLEKAVAKAKLDKQFAARMEDALLHGRSVEYRDLFSDFGEYFERPRATFPFYPHHDAVNIIDTAMFHLIIGDEQEAIEDYNLMHNRSDV